VTDAHLATPLGKPRARALGIALPGRPGANNAITDVPGVTIGYATLIVKQEHVLHALAAARRGPIEEGSVGGGTGMCCYEFNGGTGTASRVVGDDTVGVLVQAGDNPLGDWTPGACRRGIPLGAPEGSVPGRSWRS
jgi:L-aminopeptidase/D-esterase-like protein